MNENRTRSQWDSDFICPNCHWWLRAKSSVTYTDDFMEVRLRCGRCCRRYVIWISEEDFNDETEKGRHISAYLQKRVPPGSTKGGSSIGAKRKKRKERSVGSEVYRSIRSSYKSAKRRPKETEGTE